MMPIEECNRFNISVLIEQKLQQEYAILKSQYQQSKNTIGYFYIDNLLPPELAIQIANCFPKENNFSFKKNIRERKYISAQMNQHHKLVEEVLFAFQQENVVKIISEICEMKFISPDSKLYAGGISLMKHKNYLRPHLDNSHDKHRNRWRVLNLLYYVTPDWTLEDGGALELWDKGLDNEPNSIPSFFNRLVVMQTHEASWHSVSEIQADDKSRRCISNYYFSDIKPEKSTKFHITTFRSPKNRFTDMILRFDNMLRSSIRKMFKQGIVETKHFYDKEGKHK